MFYFICHNVSLELQDDCTSLCICICVYLHIKNDLSYLMNMIYCTCSNPTHTVHVVLSELYQKKLLTVEDVNMMKKSGCTLDRVVLVQCVKSPEIMVETADVLDTLDFTQEAIMLRGMDIQFIY